MFAEFAAIATEGQWEAYSAYFDGGIPYGAVISAIFIIGLWAAFRGLTGTM